MTTSGQILFLFGFGVVMVSQFWLVWLAFKQGAWWGVGSLLIPFFALVFALIHWPQRVKIPTVMTIGGMVLAVTGSLWLTTGS
jgi:hypothetical protein